MPEDREVRSTIPAAPAARTRDDRHSEVVVSRRRLAQTLDGRPRCPICLSPLERASESSDEVACDCAVRDAG